MIRFICLLQVLSLVHCVIPPTVGHLNLDFTLQKVQGASSGPLSKISLNNGNGTITLNGKNYFVVVYEAQDWTSAGYFLFDLIGISESGDDLCVCYTYSSLNNDNLEYIYVETFTTTMEEESSSGVVVHTNSPSIISVSLPALKTLPTGIVTGITIKGSSISLGPRSTQGWLTYQSRNYTLIPFNTVNCNDCGNGGWYELHSMLVQNQQLACFGILYLEFTSHNTVSLSYGLCFPTLQTLEIGFSASWSGSLSNNKKIKY
eukprot:TRINITY_DN5740_c0_g1_i2.p1 TRINITY_DN5740_c0_g1~~TRINITY_DN5740_c0_g1_i2.p1  ORF type:complete len:260 (+),score=30.87 TRINITY_DN5740_c0_g1_i2:74-853(+)